MTMTPDQAATITAALASAKAFISGFEGDELQDGIDELLAKIDAAAELLSLNTSGQHVSVIIRSDDVRAMRSASRDACRADLIRYHNMILIGEETPDADELPDDTDLDDVIDAISEFGEQCIILDVDDLATWAGIGAQAGTAADDDA